MDSAAASSLSLGSTRKELEGRHVVVHVPNGEIVDVGTTFVVTVLLGRLERVTVEEGRVTVRLQNVPPMTLASGQAWERAPAPTTLLEPPADMSQTVPGAMANKRRARPYVPPPRPAVSSSDAPPGLEEDAAYLHVIQLVRAHDDSGACDAARDYLRRFPDGFRRREIQRIVTP